MFELQTPNRITKHEYAQDSAGAGRWRGGLGVETLIQFGGEKSKGVVFGDGVDNETRAFGLFGGKVGSINEMEFKFPDGSRYRPKSKEIVSDIPRGTILRQIAGGGGGYGDPYLRPAEQVVREVRNGTLSLPKAQEEYGVAIDPVTIELIQSETEQLRGKGGKLDLS
jgi:N-methylhydantoinase B